VTTRIWTFLPVELDHVPPPKSVAAARDWLREAMPAYKVEDIDHGKITFFDCGGNMGSTYCPGCNAELSAPDWSDWMTQDYDEEKGFHFSTRVMHCCKMPARLDGIVFENPCMFGRFAIQVTDTMKTYSETEITDVKNRLADTLGCPMRYLEAHY
jgi:hypothetical protein